mgnify:CR=1 FL=1
MELQDFKSFNSLYATKDSARPPLIHRKMDIEKRPFFLSKCVQLHVKQQNKGILYFKTSFDGDYQQADFVRFCRHGLTFPADLNQLSDVPIPISQQKYNDLMALLPYVPSVCHAFYKNLEHSSNTNKTDYPEEDIDGI